MWYALWSGWWLSALWIAGGSVDSSRSSCRETGYPPPRGRTDVPPPCVVVGSGGKPLDLSCVGTECGVPCVGSKLLCRGPGYPLCERDDGGLLCGVPHVGCFESEKDLAFAYLLEMLVVIHFE